MTARKLTRSAQIKKADKLWSLAVRQRDGFVCVVCGNRTRTMQAMHGIGRDYHATRWDLRNGFCGCINCHKSYTHRPLQWDRWLHDIWGDALYDELRAQALNYNKQDLDAIISDLQRRLTEADAVHPGEA